MAIKTLATVSLLASAVFTAVILAQEATAPKAPGYAWAESCRNCHQEIYDSWAKTKHSTALERLSGDEQQKECIGCHVTGPKTPVLDGKKVLNRGVQCEACHGGAAAHAADTALGRGLVRVPSSATCEQCHNDKSPKFRGFWYDAMKSLVHKKPTT